MSTGQDADGGNAIMQKRGFCLDRRVYSIQPRAIFARCATSASTASSETLASSPAAHIEWQKFQHRPPAGFEWDLKATAIAADGEGAGWSGC